MLEALRDLSGILRISRPRGLFKLLSRSNELRASARPCLVIHALIALEKQGLNRLLLEDAGLDVSSEDVLDRSCLDTLCEYLYEIDLLERLAPGVYRARNRRRFASLLEAMYGCYAYHEPILALDKLLRGEWHYGRDVVRDDQYDALASATLTSVFSYGFSRAVLRRVEARGLLDLGCGTGEYLAYLRRNGFQGALWGLDASVRAVAEGRERGFETPGVRLLAGDLFHLAKIAAEYSLDGVDVVSFMFVLHEFEDAQVHRILETIRETYPQARILLTELADRPSEQIRATRRTVFPELKLVHRLSRQVLRTPEEWKRLFELEGYQPALERTNQLTNHACLLFGPTASAG